MIRKLFVQHLLVWCLVITLGQGQLRLTYLHHTHDVMQTGTTTHTMWCPVQCCSCCCCNCVVAVLLVLFCVKVYLKWRVAHCKSNKRMDGKTVVITGANTGIGKETALDLAKRRARVILACRDIEKANAARDDIIRISGNKDVIVKKLDLTSLASVRAFAKDINATEPRLDVLINNAGAGGLPLEKTEDGLLVGMQVNYFGPFLLTNLLVDLIKKSAPSRIVFVSSLTHYSAAFDVDDLNFDKPWMLPPYRDMHVYACSKLANILNANELARKLAKTGVTANSLHPGTIYTGIWRNLPWGLRQVYTTGIKYLFKSPLEGSQTTIHVAVSEEVEGVTGKYFADCKEKIPSELARNEELAKKLWRISEGFVTPKKKQ